MVYMIFFCLTIPMLLMLPLLEIRSCYIVGFILLGTVVALSAYEVNTIVYPTTGLGAGSPSELVPPMTEELLKAMPVLLYAVLLDDRKSRVLLIAMAVGAGLVILENSMILIDDAGSVTASWATARGFSANLMHGLCTVVAGAGIICVKKQKKLFYTGTFGLPSISIIMHALSNLLIQSDYDYIGMAMPLIPYGLVYWLYKGQRVRLLFQRVRSIRPGESGCPGAGGTYRGHGGIPDESTSVLDPAMAGEVFSAIRALAGEGFTVLIVIHEMKLAWDVSSRTFYMDQGELYKDGPPGQILGRPRKERTRAFVKGLGVFEQEIISRRLGYIEIGTAIEELGCRQILSQRHVSDIELIFGKSCVQILLGCMGDEIRLGFAVEVSKAGGSYLVAVIYGGNALNPFTDCADSLSMVLPSRMVRQYSHRFQNGNNQMNLYL